MKKEPKVMLATMLGALLAKHGIIPKYVVTNSREHPVVTEGILAVAGDLLDFLGGGEAEMEAAADTTASAVIIGEVNP